MHLRIYIKLSLQFPLQTYKNDVNQSVTPGCDLYLRTSRGLLVITKTFVRNFSPLHSIVITVFLRRMSKNILAITLVGSTAKVNDL